MINAQLVFNLIEVKKNFVYSNCKKKKNNTHLFTIYFILLNFEVSGQLK